MEPRIRGFAVLVAGALVGPLSAQVNRLNGPLPHEVRTGRVRDYAVSADGSRVVYRADKRAENVNELFSVPADGSAPSVRLNGPLPAGVGIWPDFQNRSFALASGGRVVYRAEQTTAGVHELLVVPIDGSAGPVRITPAGFDVAGFWLTAADEVLFRSDGLHLFRVPLTGGVPEAIVVHRLVDRVWTSADGATTVFSTFQAGQSRLLFRVPTDGSLAPVQLDASVPSSIIERTSFFDEVRFAPDGVHVVYREVMLVSDGDEPDNRYDLRSATLDGSHPTLTLSQTTQWFRGAYAFDPQSTSGRVAFVEAGAVNSIAFDGTGLVALGPVGIPLARPPLVRGPDVYFEQDQAGNRAIVHAAIDGSQPVTPLFPHAPLTVRELDLVDASTLAFASWDSGAFGGLYSVPVGGGTPLLLNPPPFPHYGGLALRVVPGAAQIVYKAAVGPAEPHELFRVPTDGGAPPVQLSSPLVSTDVVDFAVVPGERVLYTSFEGSPVYGYGLFGAPLHGGGPIVRYNEAIVSETVAGDVTGFRSTVDGATVVYRADQEEDEAFDLYAAHASGLGAPLRLTGGLAGAPLVLEDLELTPSGERVFFQTSAGGTFVLWSAPTTAPAASVQLDTSAFEFDFPVRASPDGAFVVYTRALDVAGQRELRSVPSDGATAPVTLHPPLQPGHGVQEFAIAPDGGRAVYRAGADGVLELFSVPLDGSAAPVRLHAPLPAGRAVAAFRIGPDGRRVVFSGDLAVDERVELYSAPVSGGAAPRKLSGPLVAAGDVTHFVLSPDGRTVVYRADQLADERFELYSVPIEGRVRRLGAPAAGPTRLTALIGVRRVEPDFAPTPDGMQVVYRSNQVVGGEFELFRVPIDGSAAPTKLSATAVAGGDVRSFALAPDGSRAVYMADHRVTEIRELFGVPLSGGTPVLFDPLPAHADVIEYRIDPESRRVLYLADRVIDTEELFSVPLDASAPPVRVNPLLAPGANVRADFAVLQGGPVLYRADQEQLGAIELFVALDLADAVLPAERARQR